jgi:8-oxo-dGTP pyrophosphatase MutT (NUDIX family)
MGAARTRSATHGTPCSERTVTEAPRPAATCVVLRPRGDEHECFMLVRSSKSPFMPHALVFPGGRLDPEDGDVDDDESWRTAARRECREEAGLELDDGALDWFDTWCTPSAEPRRFLARFFLAELAGDDGSGAAADGHETHDGRWCTAAEALAAWREGEADLPPPTLCILMLLHAHGPSGLRTRAGAALLQPILPKAVIEGGEIQVVMPHDPGYDALDGASATAPDRVAGLPTRFARRDNRWVPC